MKRHRKVIALLRDAEHEHRCAVPGDRALYHALRRRVGAREVVSPYPNLFADIAYWDSLNAEDRSLHMIRALARIHPKWTFAGLSAACVYGYHHAYSLHDGSVSIASPKGSGRNDADRLHRIYMRSVPRWRCRGIQVTSPARTLIDCAGMPFDQALSIFDSALRAGHVTAADVATLMVQTNCDEPAIRKLLRHANPLRENGGESWAYARIVGLGYAEPMMQVEFDNPNSPDMPYRVDFCWKLADGRIIVAEYDGMAKYADAGNQKRASLQAKLDYERRREQDLAAQRVSAVVHFFFEDVADVTWLDDKLAEAGVPKIR